jgi:sugar/nucleoside kinase (ribokinase family)
MSAVAVLGDIFYDYLCDLGVVNGEIPVDLVARNVDVVGEVAGLVGGAGMQFGIAATRSGFAPVTVIGKVGGLTGAQLDAEGTAALEAMTTAGIDPALAFDPDHRTGRAMITYFPGDVRFMVSDPGANATFRSSDLTAAMLAAAATARLFYVSGYALIEAARREAIRPLIAAARVGGATIALDVVPHDFEMFMPRSVVEDMLATVDWILLAASTGRRLARTPATATEDDVLVALLARTRSVALFHHPSVATIAHDGERHDRTYAYAPGAASRGQSARAHAELLYEFVGSRDGSPRG